MKKKLMLFLALIMCVTGIWNQNIYVQAEDIADEDIDFSEVMTEDALVGYAEMQTKGVYLMNGVSVINDAGGGKIGWGGVTYAARTCKVSVTAIVERLVNGSWTRVTSSSNTVANGLTAAVSKATLVGSGYSYRVRCYHYASSDASSSSTDALRM